MKVLVNGCECEPPVATFAFDMGNPALPRNITHEIRVRLGGGITRAKVCRYDVQTLRELDFIFVHAESS